MSTIERVKSNWKGTPSEPVWTADLGQSNLLTGPNGSGKSRIIEALELCLTGSVSGFLGRKAVKDSKMLWRAKAKGKGPLFVEANLSDGRTLRWEQARSNGKAKCFVDGEPLKGFLGASLTVGDVRANLFGSPATAEKWLSSQLNFTTTEVLALLGEKAEDHPYVWSLVQPFANSPTPSGLIENLKKRARASKGEAETAQKLIEEMEHAIGPAVTDKELYEAQKAVTEAENASVKAIDRCEDVSQLRALHQQCQDLSGELAMLPEVDPQGVSGLKTAQSILHTLKVVAEEYPNNQLCPCCHKTLDKGMESLKERATALEGYIRAGQQTDLILKRRKTLTVALEGAQNRGKSLLSRVNGDYLKRVSEGHNPQDDVEAAQAQIAQAQEVLDELQRRRIGTQAPSMAQATVNRAAEAYEGYTEAVKLVEAIIADAVTQSVDEFNEALAKIYPAHLGKPKLALRPQVSVGIERNGVVGAPSGGEEALLMLAIATVIAYLNPNEELTLLVMEDRAIDAFTLNTILDNWNGCEYGQVFIPTTLKGDNVDGSWNVVDCWPQLNMDETVETSKSEVKSVDPFDAHPS